MQRSGHLAFTHPALAENHIVSGLVVGIACWLLYREGWRKGGKNTPNPLVKDVGPHPHAIALKTWKLHSAKKVVRINGLQAHSYLRQLCLRANRKVC